MCVSYIKEVKIKCDDCKFVEDCVDYGWEGCKKFTPAPSTPMTNEEWFCGLSTEEKAKWLENKMTWAAQEQGTFTAKGWEKWLKQPHTFK